MKKISIAIALVLFTTVNAQVPNKLFDVRNGNGIVDGGVAQSFATYIVYKDSGSKDDVINALCDLGNYDSLPVATRPSRQAFANQEIKNWLRQKVKDNRQRINNLAVVPANESDLP